MSWTFHTMTHPARMGLPFLSFIFMMSLFKLLERREIFLVEYRGKVQKNPVDLIVPLYFPKKVRTVATLGSF